jgi:CRISPR-associated protein Cas5t
MLKAIRVRLWQQLPNYRKPASFLIRESFPLPPYSSVIGMVHTAYGFKEYHPMKVSVQGRYASEVSDLNVMYNFGIKYDPTRHQYKVKNEKGEYDGINRGVKSAHLLTDVELVLHILPENEEDFDVVLNGIKAPQTFLSLGRYEDIIRIDAVDVVALDAMDESDMLPSCPYCLMTTMKIVAKAKDCTSGILEAVDNIGRYYGLTM